MSSVHICPCCTHSLLRHVRAGGIYWFCSHCHQEMPVLSSTGTSKSTGMVVIATASFQAV